MVIVSKKKNTEEDSKTAQEQTWDNPVNPESATDARDLEQLERQKKEAEIRKNNLTTDNDDK